MARPFDVTGPTDFTRPLVLTFPLVFARLLRVVPLLVDPLLPAPFLPAPLPVDVRFDLVAVRLDDDLASVDFEEPVDLDAAAREDFRLVLVADAAAALVAEEDAEEDFVAEDALVFGLDRVAVARAIVLKCPKFMML